MEFKKKLLMKVDFVDKQIENIENFSDDAAFTKAVKESNNVIAKINSEINMEEIEVAKELQLEGKLRREELDALIEDEDDDEINEALKMYEKDLENGQFSGAGELLKTGSQFKDETTQSRIRSDTDIMKEVMLN